MDALNSQIKPAVAVLERGGIIAYPTEAVYGLGCDPFNEKSVLKILSLKRRSAAKGLILISHSWETVADLIMPLEEKILDEIFKSWPGPTTWIFPAKLDRVPYWLRGDHESLAIRIIAHPVARALCQEFNTPIVSTSANIEGKPPARSSAEVLAMFPTEIDYIVKGATGALEKPTPIYDALTKKALRL